MVRQLTPRSSLENLKREAKRWLRALREHDPAARARLLALLPDAPAEPRLRDVQLALAREHGFAGWAALKGALEARRTTDDEPARAEALRALLHAAGTGDLARLDAILDAHPDLIDERSSADEGRRTALHRAVFGRQPRAVERLLERGADPNVRDEGDNASPLHFAAEQQSMEMIRPLVEHGADTIGEGDGHELEVIGWATCFDRDARPEVVDYLLAHGARHTIFSAVATDEPEVVRALATASPELLARRMDVTNHRRTPLHLAVVKRKPRTLEALLALGADPSLTDAAGLTPLDLAALAGDEPLVRLLVDAGAPMTLPAAIALDRAEDVARLLRAEPGALRPGGRWATLVVRAAERAPGQVVERLVRAGAAVNVHDDPAVAVDGTRRYTPLHAAAFHGNLEAAAVLVAHGADVNARDSRYAGAPAGWASYAGKDEVRDFLLRQPIDLFQAIDFDLADRIAAIAQREPWQLERPFAALGETDADHAPWHPAPWHTPLAWAVASGKTDAVRALLEAGARTIPAPDGRTLRQLALDAGRDEVVAVLDAYERFDETPRGLVRRFLENACPDHHVRGHPAHATARATAERLLAKHPEIARDGLATAIACGDVDGVRRILAAMPDAAREKTGPKRWEPLLYLCFTRLDHAPSSEHAVAIATLLLDHGADPTVSFPAGDSAYTPLVGVYGGGEEDRPPHPRCAELAPLLLARGAEPYDMQVVYNLGLVGDVLGFLTLVHARSLELGRARDWEDPSWAMLDMDPYGNGARWHLDVAIARNDVALAEWVLAHGADPNAPAARAPHRPQGTPYEEAVRRGETEIAALLRRHGAIPTAVRPRTREEELVAACVEGDHARAAELIARHPELLRSPTPIRLAIEHRRPDVVAMLLDLRTSADVPDPAAGNRRPLHVAAYGGFLESATLLLDRGATVDARESTYGGTPLGWAVHGGRQAVIDLLSRTSRDVWNLAYCGKVDRLRELLREDPSLARAALEDGGTPLMWLPDDEALALEVAALLLEHGADPAARHRDGSIAAERARRRGLDAVAALLQDRGDGPDRR